MQKMKKLGIGIACVAVVFVSLAGMARNSDLYFLIKKNFTIFSEVYREVSLNYVDEVDPQKLMRKGINAMLETLDPYTVFIDEGQNQDLEIITRGSYGGVGLNVGVKGDNIVVIAPMEGYAAYQKGIRSGDIIKAVDGISVEGLSPEEVQNMTVGEPGTTVRMTLERFGMEQDLTFELERRRIEVKNIQLYEQVGPQKDIGYILLNRFSQNAAGELRDAILDVQSRRDLKGLILDLRNNPGGLLNQAVGVVDKFIGPGLKVVETRGRLEEQNNSFSTREPALAAELPLVVLQNGGSASASEIVAGALQDYDRAVVVGEQSFGKGLVQVIHPLSYNTSLKITTSRYFIPSGRSIQSVIYTHNEDNAEIDHPDSLRNAFKTRNGRTVYDGEGIAPDITISSDPPGLLETALMKGSHFFYFANRYASQHEEYNQEKVSDQLFSKFRDYLEQSNFEYETQIEQHLSEIEKKISKGALPEEAIEYVDKLEKTVNRNKQQDFIEQKEELKKALQLELISRYKGSDGQTETSLKFDPVFKEALDILNSPARYSDILAGNPGK